MLKPRFVSFIVTASTHSHTSLGISDKQTLTRFPDDRNFPIDNNNSDVMFEINENLTADRS